MAFKLSNFMFGKSELAADSAHNFIASIPPRISSREALLRSLAQALNFPDYFGHNWDALIDCLRDMSWIRQRVVVLVHSDVPQLERHLLETYLEVISESVDEWKPWEVHQLVVIFPENTRHELGAIAGVPPSR